MQHSSNTRPSGRRSRADSWPADRARPAPGRRLPRCPRGSSEHSCRRRRRPSVPRTVVHGQMLGSPTASQQTTRRHSSLKTRPVDDVHNNLATSTVSVYMYTLYQREPQTLWIVISSSECYI